MVAEQKQRAGVARRELRLPLQTGTTALWALGWGIPLIVFGVGVVALFVAKSGTEIGALLLGPIVVGAAPALLGFYGLVLARAAQPSDLTLDSKGISVAGGPDDGVTMAWVEIDPERCAVTSGRAPALVLHSRVGQEIVLGRAHARSERASLASLAATLAAVARSSKRAPPEISGCGNLHTVTCASCGAIAVPADAPAVQCTYCGAPVPIPAELRARISAAAELARAARTVDADVTALFASGTRLTRARAVLALALGFVLIVWLAALMASGAGYASGRIDLADVALVLLAAALANTSFCALASGAFVDRLAVRLVSLDLAARAPTHPGAPHACRACGCPLPEAPGAVITRCSACGSANVLGLDCRGVSEVASAQAQGLEAALRARRATTLRWRLLGVGGALASAGAAALAVVLVAGRH